MALLLPLAFYPLITVPFEPVKVVLFQAVTAGMVMMAAVSLVQKRGLRLPWSTKVVAARMALAELSAANPLLGPALAYAAAHIAATLVSIEPSQSFWGTSSRHVTITVVSMVVFFLLISSALHGTEQVDRLITALLVGSVPVALYGWIQYLGLDPLVWITNSISPVHSTVGYSLFLGAYLAMVIPFTLSRLVGGEADGRKRPLPYALVLLLQVTCLLLTQARGAWLGLLGGCLLFLGLLAYRWRRGVLIVVSMTVLIAGGLLFVLMNEGSVLPLQGKPGGISADQVVRARAASNTERILLWRHTLAMIPHRFPLGYGPETFETAFGLQYAEDPFFELDWIRPWDPHNLILNHLMATGILGTLALFWVLARFYETTLSGFRRAADWRVRVLAASMLGSATAYLIQAQFNPNSIVAMSLFWLILALGVSMDPSRVRRTETRNL